VAISFAKARLIHFNLTIFRFSGFTRKGSIRLISPTPTPSIPRNAGLRAGPTLPLKGRKIDLGLILRGRVTNIGFLLKGKGINKYLPLQGGGMEGDGVVGIV